MRRIKREVNYGEYKFKETTGHNVFSYLEHSSGRLLNSPYRVPQDDCAAS